MFYLFFAALVLLACEWDKSNTKKYDIVIYGGISAAIQTSRMLKTVAVIEPSNRVGGLTTGSLGQTDIGTKQAIGVIPGEFYEDIRSYYDNLANWNWQNKDDYRDGGQTNM